MKNIMSSILSNPYALIIIAIVILLILVILAVLDDDWSMNNSRGSKTCTYNLAGISSTGNVELTDLKVEVVNCDATKDNYKVLETVDFEKYILGVALAEAGPSSPDEALKAQMIAVRNFSLTRHLGMCPSNPENCFHGYNASTGVIRMRACTNDQVYWDYTKDCPAQDRSGQPTLYCVGVENPNKTWKKALSAERQAQVEALAAEVKRAGDEEARIEGLVTAEAARAAEAEGALDERLVEVETFFKTAADETIDTALDTLVEIQKYLDGEGAVADQMLADIAANAKAIEDMDAAYKAADGTLQGNIDTLAGTVATKAAQADLESAVERIETAEGDIDKNAEDIAALQAKFGEGEGSVADMIADAVASEAELRVAGDEAAEASAAAALKAAQDADAKAVAADGKAVKAQEEVDALELVVDTKAAASDVTELQGKVSTLEGDMTQAKSDIDAVEALAAANQAAITALQEASATHATKAELQAESERAVDKENALQAAIDAFVEVSEEEINALFEVRP